MGLAHTLADADHIVRLINMYILKPEGPQILSHRPCTWPLRKGGRGNRIDE